LGMGTFGRKKFYVSAGGLKVMVITL